MAKKHIVTCNGNEFASFDTRKKAEEYITMQKCKVKGAGLAPNPGKVPTGRESFASRQTWDIKEK